MLTKESAAAALHGSEYREEGSRELFADMKAAGLVAVFGASDDLMEFRGAIDDETSPSREGEPIGRNGLINSRCDDGDDCPYYKDEVARAARIFANWDDGSGYSWTYTTTIPHATFDVVEIDGDERELYCRGIVFAIADVPA